MRIRPVSLAALAVIAPAAPVWAQAPAAQASASRSRPSLGVVGDASLVKPQLEALSLPLEVRTTRQPKPAGQAR